MKVKNNLTVYPKSGHFYFPLLGHYHVPTT